MTGKLNLRVRKFESKVMSKLRNMKNRGQLQKVELFPELKWYHKLWNRIVVGVVITKDWLKRVLYD